MWQNILVALIVITAVIFTVRKFYHSFKQTGRCACSCGCSAKEAGDCCGTPDHLIPMNTCDDDCAK